MFLSVLASCLGMLCWRCHETFMGRAWLGPCLYSGGCSACFACMRAMVQSLAWIRCLLVASPHPLHSLPSWVVLWCHKAALSPPWPIRTTTCGSRQGWTGYLLEYTELGGGCLADLWQTDSQSDSGKHPATESIAFAQCLIGAFPADLLLCWCLTATRGRILHKEDIKRNYLPHLWELWAETVSNVLIHPDQPPSPCQWGMQMHSINRGVGRKQKMWREESLLSLTVDSCPDKPLDICKARPPKIYPTPFSFPQFWMLQDFPLGQDFG